MDGLSAASLGEASRPNERISRHASQTPQHCLIIESLGMAARSAGFFVPGALGIQEVALILVGGLVGIAPQPAMLLAIVKRLRDVVLGVPGLFLWQWLEGRRLVAPKQS